VDVVFDVGKKMATQEKLSLQILQVWLSVALFSVVLVIVFFVHH
jgi:hypothetical protein